MGFHLLHLAWLSALVFCAGCSEPASDEPSRDLAKQRDVPCSTGPLFTREDFVQGRWLDAGVLCTPHCGQEDSRGTWLGVRPAYPLAALPTGECDPTTPACNMDTAQHHCPADGEGTGGLWLNNFCACTDGQWKCEGSYVGGGVADCRADAGS